MKLVLVDWVDSSSVHGWTPLTELMRSGTNLMCATVGWEIKKTKEAIHLISSLAFNNAPNGEVDSGAGNITIPLCSIKKIWTLKEPGKR